MLFYNIETDEYITDGWLYRLYLISEDNGKITFNDYMMQRLTKNNGSLQSIRKRIESLIALLKTLEEEDREERKAILDEIAFCRCAL